MLRIREIQMTTDEEGERIPASDAEGRVIELWHVDIPLAVEAQGPEAITQYVAAQRAAAEGGDDA